MKLVFKALRIPFALLLILTVFLLCLIKDYQNVNPYLFLLSSILVLIGFISLGKSKSLGKIFLLFYYLISMPFHLALSVLLPSYLVSTRFNALYDESLFSDNDLVLRYFALGTICFLIIFLAIHIFDRNKTQKTKIQQNLFMKKVGFVNHSLFFLFIASILQIIEKRIGANGYVDYAIKGFTLFFLAQVVASNACCGDTIKLKNIAFIILGVLIYSIPSMLVGMRGDFVLAFFYSFLFLSIANTKGALVFLKKHFLVACSLLIGFLFTFNIVSSFKFGSGVDSSSNVFYLLIRRMTGIFDGTTILKFLRTNEVNLDFKNFVGVAIQEQADHSTGYRANQFFTFFVQGFPTNDQTGSASPAFVSALFYGHFGWFLIIFYIAILCGLVSKKATGYFFKIKSGSANYSLRVKGFVSLFALHNVIFFYLMGGNYEQIKAFSPILVCAVLEKLFELISLNGKKQQEYIIYAPKNQKNSSEN